MSKPAQDPSSKRTWLSVASLSLLFVAAFFVLRSLPYAECGFLHYVEIVNADGEIELCATNHAGFIDLSVLSYPVEASLATDRPLKPGIKSKVALKLKTAGGMPIAAHELATTHTEKIHLMVIDPSLEDYHHLHPEPEGLDGIYRFEFVPKKAGTYRVFTEIVPVRSRRQAIALSELEVAGEVAKPVFERSIRSCSDGVQFVLHGAPAALKTGRDYRLELEISDLETGAPAELEMVMGAKGHMVAFDERALGFAHMHPVDSVADVRVAGLPKGQEKDTDLAFLFNVPNPGWYRLFAQIQLEGESVFGRFNLRVDD
ncbi:MAG: hypothetical protein ACPGGN_05095 [Opitutales bacterium]